MNKYHYTQCLQTAVLALPAAVIYWGGFICGYCPEINVKAMASLPALSIIVPLIAYMIFMRKLTGGRLIFLYKELCRAYGLFGSFIFLMHYASILMIIVSLICAWPMRSILMFELSLLIWLASGLLMRRMLYKQPLWSISLSLLILLPVSGAATLYIAGYREKVQGDKIIQKLKARGIRFSLEDITRQYNRPYPGTDVYRKTMELCRRMTDEKTMYFNTEVGELLKPWAEIPDETYRQAESYLKQIDKLLKSLDELTQYDKAAFSYSEDGLFWDLNELNTMRNLGRIEYIRMMHAVHRQDKPAVLKRFHAIGNLSKQLCHIPNSLRGLVAIAVESMRLNGMSRAINSGMDFTAAELDWVISELDASIQEFNRAPTASLNLEIAVFRLETAGTLSLLKNLADMSPEQTPAKLIQIGNSSLFLRPLIRHVQNFDRQLLLKYLSAALNGVYRSETNIPLAAPVTNIISKSFPAFLRRINMITGYANSLKVICALEKYHLVNRKYPDDLSELVPEFISAVPDSMKYINGTAKTPAGNVPAITVYSIGPDQIDHHGDVIVSGQIKDVGFIKLKKVTAELLAK